MKFVLSLLIVGIVSMAGCTSQSRTDLVDRQSANYKEAVRELGDDAETAFKKQLQRGVLEFYAMGEHPFQQELWFPGLSKKEVHEYITIKKMPFKVRFEKIAPVIVTADGEPPFDGGAYFAAVDDLLSTYNRLVLHEVLLRERKA